MQLPSVFPDRDPFHELGRIAERTGCDNVMSLLRDTGDASLLLWRNAAEATRGRAQDSLSRNGTPHALNPRDADRGEDLRPTGRSNVYFSNDRMAAYVHCISIIMENPQMSKQQDFHGVWLNVPQE